MILFFGHIYKARAIYLWRKFSAENLIHRFIMSGDYDLLLAFFNDTPHQISESKDVHIVKMPDHLSRWSRWEFPSVKVRDSKTNSMRQYSTVPY